VNWELFAAFLLITVALILVPGPIVTLVVATSVSKGLRAGLITVVGTSAGNAVLLAVIGCGLTGSSITRSTGSTFCALSVPPT
jgi:threonine/homoserine/homoserine lactone efflux protein